MGEEQGIHMNGDACICIRIAFGKEGMEKGVKG